MDFSFKNNILIYFLIMSYTIFQSYSFPAQLLLYLSYFLTLLTSHSLFLKKKKTEQYTESSLCLLATPVYVGGPGVWLIYSEYSIEEKCLKSSQQLSISKIPWARGRTSCTLHLIRAGIHSGLNTYWSCAVCVLYYTCTCTG